LLYIAIATMPIILIVINQGTILIMLNTIVTPIGNMAIAINMLAIILMICFFPIMLSITVGFWFEFAWLNFY